MTLSEADIVTATIPRFREISGIGRSRIYELLDAGEIESVYVGARRLIVVDSYRRLIERLRSAGRSAEPATRHRKVPPRARLAQQEPVERAAS